MIPCPHCGSLHTRPGTQARTTGMVLGGMAGAAFVVLRIIGRSSPVLASALWVGGSLMQNPYGLLLDVGAMWNRILGGIYPGMIHFCGSQCLGDSTTGSVMIRRPSTVAEPAVQAQQEQAYQAAYDQALYRASYLAKNFSKGSTPHRVREFGCSQL